jgi:hypothetical protein
MTQTNSNATYVLNNTNSSVVTTGGSSTSGVPAATVGIKTLLGNANATGVDSNTNNGNYDTAAAIQAQTTTAQAKTAALFTKVATEAHFLPTNGVTTTSGEFGAAGNYQTPASWTIAPKLAGTASAFTLTNTADSGKTFTLAESISGSPFTTGNGALAEALTFTGKNSDTLVVKHNVSVANVPATTNNNVGSALDVRNEAYAENYVKTGVTSSYALNTTHKYAEANGNQTLNDARAEVYAYKDAGLTINSSVKTGVADAAYINGAEKIVESNAANYHYASTVASTAGTIDYVVTDVRNLAQVDQRTYTNITMTNVAQFKVVDKTVAANPLTVEASGVITGTTKNLAPTTFAPTNAKFTVNNNNYSLAVDAGQFTKNALNQNVFDNVLSLDDGIASTTNALGLGNGGTLFAPIKANQPVVPASLASAKYFDATGTTFTGTDFADVITIKDVKDTAGNFVGGNVNGGAGNDTITGSQGNDTIDISGAGADSILTNGGNDTITGFSLGADTLTVSKGTGITKVSVSFADGKVADYNVAANATTDTVIPATAKTADDLAKITGVTPDAVDWTGTNVAESKVGTDNADKFTGLGGADTLTGGAGADTFIYKRLSDSGAVGGTQGTDTITDFNPTQDDKIDLSAVSPFKGGKFIGSDPFSANATGEVRFDEANHKLQGSSDADDKAEFEIILTGVTAADLSETAFIFA